MKNSKGKTKSEIKRLRNWKYQILKKEGSHLLGYGLHKVSEQRALVPSEIGYFKDRESLVAHLEIMLEDLRRH